MRVLQIGADRSKRGILYPGTLASDRQKAIGEAYGELDILGLSLAKDRAKAHRLSDHVRIYPTASWAKICYPFGAILIALTLPKPDCISTQDPFETGLIGWVISRIRGVPLHVQVHIHFLTSDWNRTFANRMRTRIARFVLNRAARIRAVSNEIKESIEKELHPTAPISVLPVYVDIERYRNAVHDPALESRFASFKTRLLVVSRLVEPQKNIALAIESFARAPQDACLIIVGEGPESDRLESLARAHGVRDRVFFEGEQDAAPYYRLADILLVPSRYEGYGMVIIEALAAGKPVLSTDVGIAREAGAMITDVAHFPDALHMWCVNGSRTGALKIHTYPDLGAYGRALADDVKATL